MEQFFLERAKVIHRENPVVDAHMDLANEVYARRLAGERHVIADRYLQHFKDGGLKVLVSSVYVNSSDLPEKGLHAGMGQIAALITELEEVKDDMCLVRSQAELDAALQEGKIAVLLSLEGLDPVGNDLYLLRAFYEMGVRGASLTWSRRNAFGEGCCFASDFREIPGGLTELGRQAIAQMENLGMWLDISHLNNAGFAEVLELAKKPFIASHSNAWRVNANYRNLRDDQIERLAERGGVIGLNACGAIAGAEPEPKEDALRKLCEHVEYLTARAGEDHVGLGFDLCNGLNDAMPRIHFDNGGDDLLANHGEMPLLTAMLLSRGMTEETVVKIIGRNFLQYYRSILK